VPAAEEGVRRAANAQIFLGGEIHHLARLGDIDAERLFRVDMLAGVQNREADISMGQRHRQVDDDFDVIAFQHLVDPHAGNAEFFCALLGRRRPHIGDRAQFDIRKLLHGRQVGLADDAAADDADADFSHGDSASIRLSLVGVKAQPLTAPAVSPATMCFCANRNRMMVGRIVSVTNARIRCHSDEYSP